MKRDSFKIVVYVLFANDVVVCPRRALVDKYLRFYVHPSPAQRLQVAYHHFYLWASGSARRVVYRNQLLARTFRGTSGANFFIDNTMILERCSYLS